MAAHKVIAASLLFLKLTSASATSLEGVWRSDGWSSVYEIRGNMLRSFEVTRDTCVAGLSAERVSSRTIENGATFRLKHGGLLRVLAGEDEDHKRLKFPTGLISITVSRTSALPDVCTPSTANTPLGNFDVFARTFAENYIAFDLRQVDWGETVAQQRAKLTAETTPIHLFEILAAMIEPLTDIHTGIEHPKSSAALLLGCGLEQIE